MREVLSISRHYREQRTVAMAHKEMAHKEDARGHRHVRSCPVYEQHCRAPLSTRQDLDRF
jgi:hypothetical protein